MNVLVRLAAFFVGVLVLFAGANAAGRAIDPVHDDVAGAMEGGHGDDTHTDGGSETTMEGMEMGPAAGGLAVADGELRLSADGVVLSATEARPFSFRILDNDGEVVTDFDPEQGGVELHLVVVRRDFNGFQHVHPTMAGDGTWSIPLALASPGTHRAFADVTVDGKPHTLGIDLFAAGDFRPEPLPAPEPSSFVDGYQVTSSDPELRGGVEASLAFSVTRDGSPVVDLEPYLGAAGHLVGLRQGDLAYLHLHPEAVADEGTIEFAGVFPSAGTYRLYLQFQHEGTVRTVPFTVEVSDDR